MTTQYQNVKRPNIESYKVKIVGRRSLLLHQIPQSLGERGRGERMSPEEEANAAIYRDSSGVIALPSLNLKASIRDGAKQFRVPGRGKTSYKDLIKSGIEIEPSMIPLKVPGGKNPENSWKIDTRPVVVQRARIMRSRPRFDEWELEFTANIVDPLITAQQLREIIESAGRYVGLGDFRPEFGLFDLVSFEKC